MELVAPRRATTFKGGVIATGALLLSLTLGARLQSLAGTSGVLLALLISAAVASWYAGRWAGLITTGVAVIVVAYFFMPPNYSFRIEDPHDSAALGSFAIGGVIISLLCGAAWRLRSEADSLRRGETEMMMLRSRNSRLALQSKHEGAALAASDHLLRRFAGATRTTLISGKGAPELVELAHSIEEEPSEPAPTIVDCSTICSLARTPLPTVWADESELRTLFDLLTCATARTGEQSCLEITASQLPEWWLFVAVIRAPAWPLSQLEFSVCERIVIRQGGRCWANATLHGDWEMRFLLRHMDGGGGESRA